MKKILIISIILLLVNNCFAQNEFTQKDRELLIELKVTMQQMEKRFEQIDNRLDNIRADMRMLLYTFLGGIFILIGFVMWYRRTTIAPTKKATTSLKSRQKTSDSKVLLFLLTSFKSISESIVSLKPLVCFCQFLFNSSKVIDYPFH